MANYLVLAIVIIAGNYLLHCVVEGLNLAHTSLTLPPEFEGFYDSEKYRKSQEYLKANTALDLVSETFFTSVTLVFILAGGFNIVDTVVRNMGYGGIVSGLIFAALIVYALQVLKIPFSLYHTFVIEEKYGFNKTTAQTFLLDTLKSWLLLGLIGGIAFAVVLWFFARFQSTAWLWSWLALTLFQVFLLFIAPVLIMPLFNKFKPLEDCELKRSLEQYAKEQRFKMKGLYTMDGSKRSTKSNAYFTGFGKYRRIVLFDTLIERHTVDELVSVLAHEMGHYKKKHILKTIILSIATTGILFYVLSLFINNPSVFAAFKMSHLSIYASFFFFGIFYTPVHMLFSVISGIISRKHEYQADAYAATTYGKPQALIAALKKLTVNNLSNLTPHPLKVFLEYSHPPVLERIKALQNVSA